MNMLETLKANMWKAIHDREATAVGGGIYSPEERHTAYMQILLLEHESFTRRTEVCELKLAQGRLEHDQKLLLEALKQVLDYLLCDDAKTMHDAIQVAKRANAAYRHVSGT